MPCLFDWIEVDVHCENFCLASLFFFVFDIFNPIESCRNLSVRGDNNGVSVADTLFIVLATLR